MKLPETSLPPGPSTTPRPGRTPGGWVVWDPTAEEASAEVDWSRWYLTDEDDMGESGEQDHVITVLKSSLSLLARERGWSRVLVASDQFFAWLQQEPLVRVSPDVYLVDDPPPPPLPDLWETWRADHRPPRFAVEVVSRKEWRKDYEGNPPKYAQLGAQELVVFDPWAASQSLRVPERTPIQLFRRAADGAFVRVYRGDGPARSEELAAWLIVARGAGRATLRVARDAAGSDIVPTEGEALQESERARQESERARQESERARQESERALRDNDRALQAAMAELERLRRDREP